LNNLKSEKGRKGHILFTINQYKNRPGTILFPACFYVKLEFFKK